MDKTKQQLSLPPYTTTHPHTLFSSQSSSLTWKLEGSRSSVPISTHLVRTQPETRFSGFPIVAPAKTRWNHPISKTTAFSARLSVASLHASRSKLSALFHFLTQNITNKSLSFFGGKQLYEDDMCLCILDTSPLIHG